MRRCCTRERACTTAIDRLDGSIHSTSICTFRPNSAWARRDLESGSRRFQDLGADDHAFVREGEAWMPVVVRIGEVPVMADSRERRQTVTVTTTTRPSEVLLDPDNVLIDIVPANNRKTM